MRPCDVAKIWLKPMVLWNTSILDKPHVVVILLLSMLVNEKSLESWPKTITMAPCFAKRLKTWHCKYIKCQKHNIILRKNNLAKQNPHKEKQWKKWFCLLFFPGFFLPIWTCFWRMLILFSTVPVVTTSFRYQNCIYRRLFCGVSFPVFPYIGQFIPG